jgi:hypothetical protein
MFKSSSPTTVRSLMLQFVGTALALVVLWVILGGAVGILIAYLVINFVGLGIRALNLKTSDRPDRAAIPEILRSFKARNHEGGR